MILDIKCCIENNGWAKFLDWRACFGAVSKSNDPSLGNSNDYLCVFAEHDTSVDTRLMTLQPMSRVAEAKHFQSGGTAASFPQKTSICLETLGS